MAKLTLHRIKKEVYKVTGCTSEDEGYKAGVCMLASLEVGTNADRVARFTGYPRSLVRTFGKRLRENGVWKDGQIHADWFGEHGGISFCLDVNIARGFMKRAET